MTAQPETPLEARPRTTFESDLWPALRGFWHPVAELSSVDPGPTPAKLLGENLVLVRLGGELRCFEDLCVHRGTPLSLGWVEGNSLVCAYHGWEYDADGQCVRIPALEDDRSIPRKARTRTFRVTERYGLVWVCLDDAEMTDVAPFPEFDDASYTTYAAPSLVRTCSAARQIENFMDESHFAWVHEGILGDRLHAKAPAFEVTRAGYSLEFGWDERPNSIHPPGHWRQYTVQLPFTIHLQQRRHRDDEVETLYFAVCPSGARESLGFLLIARNYTLPPDQEEERRQLTATVGAQDRRIVEAQRPEQVPFDLAAELHIKGPDTAAVAYRRAMAELGVIVDFDAVSHRFVEANGLRLHIAQLGGDGLPTLLLHGVTSHWAAWLPLADVLGTERRLFALDLRGHGDSQWAADAAYATRDLATDTIEVLDALKVDGLDGGPIDVVGASWGGLTALLVAGARPDLVRSLTLIDAPPSWTQAVDDIPPRPESFVDHAEVVAFERPRYRFASDAAIERLAAFGTRPGTGGRLYFKFDPLFANRWGFRAEDNWAALGDIHAPTLIARAGAGGALAPEVAQRMVAALPRASFAEFADAGHSVHVDAPDALAAALRAFWRDQG